MWLWFLPMTMLPAHPATHALSGSHHPHVCHVICNPGKKGGEGKGTTSFLTPQTRAKPNSRLQVAKMAAYLETFQPVAHVGKALLGGDVVHENHSICFAEQLPSHAVVPVQTVCLRLCLVGGSLALVSPGPQLLHLQSGRLNPSCL